MKKPPVGGGGGGAYGYFLELQYSVHIRNESSLIQIVQTFMEILGEASFMILLNG